MKIKNIILENPESDRELFGAPTFSGYQARQELKNMDNAYAHATRQELVNHVRDLAKNQFGVKTRVSAVAKKAGARTATFWFGSGEYVAGNPDKIVHEIKAELESQGFACKFTDSGWLSVRVPEDYERNSVVEDESDDDLFGTEALRKFAVVSPDGEILKELENGTVRQAIEMARAAFVKWGDYYKDYGGIALIRSNIEGEYDENSQEIPFSTEIDESDESDDDLFGGKSHKRRNQLKIFDPDALPRLDPATQQKVYRALPSVLQDIQEDDDWDGFAENDPVQAERVLDDFTNFGRYIQQNNPVAALAVLDRNAVNYDLDESFLYVIERYTGVDMHSLVDLNDPNQEQAWHHYRSGVMKENTMNHAFESLFNEKMNLLTEAELAEPDEPERKAKTQTKQKPKLDPNMFAPKADQPLAKTDPLDDIKKNAGTDKPKVDIKKANQSDTLKATGKIAPTDDMRDMLSRIRDIDIDSDLAGYPEPKPPETLPSVDVNTKNLPAVAGQALLAAGVQNPDFHQVANLPGNMADMIRQLGKNLFGALTVTPTKRIHMIANLGGQGPNTNQEVQAVAGFLKEHGEDLGPGDIDFDNVMPGYSAQTHMFNAAGIRWMLVKDFAGQYIYCWPEEDSLDASPKLSNNTDKKQLR